MMRILILLCGSHLRKIGKRKGHINNMLLKLTLQGCSELLRPGTFQIFATWFLEEIM